MEESLIHTNADHIGVIEAAPCDGSRFTRRNVGHNALKKLSGSLITE